MVNKSSGGWATGWTMFAGTMMVLIGIWQTFAGLVAIINDSFYVATPKFIFQFDVTTWGWIHFFLGLLVLGAGFALFLYQTWARVVGVIVAGLSALGMFFWLPYYPIWACLIIAADVLVIWALTLGGHSVKGEQQV